MREATRSLVTGADGTPLTLPRVAILTATLAAVSVAGYASGLFALETLVPIAAIGLAVVGSFSVGMFAVGSFRRGLLAAVAVAGGPFAGLLIEGVLLDGTTLDVDYVLWFGLLAVAVGTVAFAVGRGLRTATRSVSQWDGDLSGR